MSSFKRGACAIARAACAIAVALSASAGVVQFAAAAPTHANVMAVRPAPVRASRSGSAPILHYALTPGFVALTVHRVTEPIQALPVPPTVTRQPAAFLPVLLPRAMFAALLPPNGASPCAATRAPVLISAVPRVPFAADECARRSFAADQRDLPPTSLVAGHNKNALYGPGYSPSHSDPNE